MIKPLDTTDRETSTKVLTAKHRYGFWFGAAAGLCFAAATWGLDAYFLSLANGLFPWLKFLMGAGLCMLAGGLTGRLAAQVDKPLLSMLLWLLAAFFFSWLILALPVQIIPGLLRIVKPDLGELLHIQFYENSSSEFGVALTWTAIFMAILGLLQIPISDSAVFSFSLGGKIIPMLASLVLMGICGTIADGLINAPFREATSALHDTIQFAVEHQGQAINPTTSRQRHLGALGSVRGLVVPPYKLMVSGYDQYLSDIQVLVRFRDAWVECEVFSNQPVQCKEVHGGP